MLHLPLLVSFLMFLLFGGVRAAQAQELDCEVSVDYSVLAGSDYAFLDGLERRVEEYLNEHAWTDDRFQRYERIDCSVDIYLQEALSLTEFRAQLVMATRRPIYGTMQTTPVVRLSDPNWQFGYREGKPLVHELQHYDPLTSVLDFYALILLGYDYDTFSERGGTPYFQQARQVAELAQSSGAAGWDPIGERTTLITQLLDPRFRPLREAYFAYHFAGLDRFTSETEEARQAMLSVLETLNQLYQNVSRQYVLDVFFSTKYAELEAAFEGSPLSGEAYALLSETDPAHSYDLLLE